MQRAEYYIYRIFTEWKSQSLYITVNDDSDSDIYTNNVRWDNIYISTAVHYMQTAHIILKSWKAALKLKWEYFD